MPVFAFSLKFTFRIFSDHVSRIFKRLSSFRYSTIPLGSENYWHVDLRGKKKQQFFAIDFLLTVFQMRNSHNSKHSSKGIFIIQAVYIACNRDYDKLILISMLHTFILCFIVCHTFTEICPIKKRSTDCTSV